MSKIPKTCLECLYVLAMNHPELHVWHFALFKTGILNCALFMKNKAISFTLLSESSD